MPSIDYRIVRSLIPMPSVLDMIDFEAVVQRGDQQRGPCPIPACATRHRREFSVHLASGIFHCFTCGRSGNQLDLWAALQNLPLYEAAQDLCRRTNNDIPWLKSRPKKPQPSSRRNR